jgi:hypothetical protein
MIPILLLISLLLSGCAAAALGMTGALITTSAIQGGGQAAEQPVHGLGNTTNNNYIIELEPPKAGKPNDDKNVTKANKQSNVTKTAITNTDMSYDPIE